MANHKRDRSTDREVVGLVPAAGLATRVAPLPCSKELYPVGFGRVGEGSGLRPKVVCQYLLERLRLAGITKVYVVLRKGKWDIPAYLGDGSALDMHLAYLMMGLPYGAPFSLDQAFPFVEDALVALGFPDIIFQPEDAYVRLLERQAATDADVVLGLFPLDQPQKGDMMDLDERGRIRQIFIKPAQSDLRYSWINAVWTPAFTRFMHVHLATVTAQKEGDSLREGREFYVGNVIQAALGDGMRVEAVTFPDGVCLDIGTMDDLVQAVRENTPREETP